MCKKHTQRQEGEQSVTKAKVPVEIRPLRPADADAWRHLWTAYLAFYKTDLSDAIKDATFARLLDPSVPDLNALVAVQDDRPVGLVHYIFHRHCWRIEDTCYLQDLYVDPVLRGTGTGRRLIESVYAAADAAQAPSVYWMTEHHNTTGRQLYDRVGTLTDFIKYARPAA